MTEDHVPDRLLLLPAAGLDLVALERDLVIQALERVHGNQSKAGPLLGMDRDQIRYRIKKYQLQQLVAALCAAARAAA